MIDDTKAALLRSTFWEMNTISYVLDSYDTVVEVLDDDGLPTGETTTVTTIVLRIALPPYPCSFRLSTNPRTSLYCAGGNFDMSAKSYKVGC